MKPTWGSRLHFHKNQKKLMNERIQAEGQNARD